MIEPTIYHGTPLTPRPALEALAGGRAMCVSFWTPSDVEAVEALSPDIMFRQRRVLGVAGGVEARGAVVHSPRLEAILQLVGNTAVHARPVGSDPRCTRRAIPAQRFTSAGMAVWPIEGRAFVAHGRPDRTLDAIMRAVRQGLHRVDGTRPSWMRSLVPPHGRSGCDDGESLARPSYDARGFGCAGIPICQRRRYQRRAERVAL